ncbi:MAG: hypothetical protein HGA86_03950, partial [Anaerolineaceae bacterium]|nr:hypothetical protein [Anaerolineaceae bacterium]
MKFKKTPKFLRSIGIVLAIIAAVVIYAYGFQVTKVNLEETRSERRQTQLVRIIRALAKPDIIVYDKQVTDASARIMVPCPTDGYQTPETDKNKPYIVIEPACADPETTVKISGFNFAPNSGGPLYFIPPSEVTLDLGRITTDADGKFEMMAKLPDRPDTAVQYINAITRVEVGIPKLSSNVIDTWDKIVETVFLALLATTVGTLLAIPFSFLAARNIMKDVTSPLLSVAMILIFVPIGIFLGGQIGKYAILFRETIGVNLIIDLFGFLIVSTGIFFLLKLVLPQEEIQKPTGKIKALRYAGLLLAFFMTILSLSMLSAFMLVAGKWLGMNLGAVGFLGKFISSIGDILGMLLTLFAALVGGGVFLSFANRIGEFSIRHIKYVPNRIINYFMSAIAGAFALVIIASGIGWVYEVTNPVNIYFIPAGIGALLGLLTAFKYKPRDKVG